MHPEFTIQLSYLAEITNPSPRPLARSTTRQLRYHAQPTIPTPYLPASEPVAKVLTLPTSLNPGIPLELIGRLGRVFGLNVFMTLAGGMLLGSDSRQEGMRVFELGLETCEKGS